jgi:hypothetical protein
MDLPEHPIELEKQANITCMQSSLVGERISDERWAVLIPMPRSAAAYSR